MKDDKKTPVVEAQPEPSDRYTIRFDPDVAKMMAILDQAGANRARVINETLRRWLKNTVKDMQSALGML